MTQPRTLDPPRAPGGDSAAGLAFAMGAYLIWGMMPLYMIALAHMPPVEVVAHRILWSIPVAAAVLAATGRWSDLGAALRAPRSVAMAALCAALISVNWGIYVWAIGTGHALDAALGYYINPLFNVALGALLLGERLTRMQGAAVALAGLAVAVLTVEAGRLPLVALGLSGSFGFYAYFKRSLPIGPNQGFLLEVLILALPAALLLAWLGAEASGHFVNGTASDRLLLIGCGPITAIPLILYAYGAKRLRLVTIGMLQYIAPTMILLFAVFAFGEPVTGAERVAFPMIWAALGLYSATLFAARGRTARPA